MYEENFLDNKDSSDDHLNIKLDDLSSNDEIIKEDDKDDNDFNEKDYGYQEIDKKTSEKKISEETITSCDFNGFDFQNNKHNLISCVYCDRFYYKDMYIKNCNYCIHCWGWLNYQEINIEEGKYNGSYDYNDIKIKLKKTYKLHKKCNIKDCIYNRIEKAAKENKLHIEFCKLLDLNYKENIIKKTYKINNRNKLKINYDLSQISI